MILFGKSVLAKPINVKLIKADPNPVSFYPYKKRDTLGKDHVMKVQLVLYL